MPTRVLLRDLDRLPAHAHLAGRLRLGVAEHVRVAADQLARDAVGDVGPVALAGLRAEQREEGRLEEQVAELVDQLGRRAGSTRRLGDLVGLLERVRHDRLDRLRAIPGTLATERRGQLEQLDRGLARGPELEARSARGSTPRRPTRTSSSARRSSAATVADRRTSSTPWAASSGPSASAPASSSTGPARLSASSEATGSRSGSPGPSPTTSAGPQRELPGAGGARWRSSSSPARSPSRT